MKRRIKEETILFISVIKWVFLATLAGIAVGLSTTIFLKLLNWSTRNCSQYPYFFLLLPAAMFLSALMVKYLAPDAEGHGTEKVIEAVHKHAGKIKAVVVPVKLLATVVTIASGGSVGKEGPCAQIGAGVSSILSDFFRFNDNERKKLVICGISAGFASVFGTPIAGAIFGVEVLFVGAILYDVLLPSFIAGIVSYHVSASLGVTYFHHSVVLTPIFSNWFFIKVIVAGIFFGFCSLILIETLKFGDRLSKKLQVWAPLKGLVGGTVLIVLTFIFSKQYLGLGLDTIEYSLNGVKTAWYAFPMKSIFTAITLGFGGSGGIVTPIFFVGSSAGTLFASLTGLDIATFAAIGLVSVLAGAANTPMELFGIGIAPYATVACVVSFLITGHRSVYPSQILSMRKSSSIKVETGKEIENILAEARPRQKSLTGTVLKIIKMFRKVK